MTWISVILTPHTIVFDKLGTETHQKFLWLFWAIDIGWCVQIVFNFIIASQRDRKFKAIAKSYLKGCFIFDIVATVPPMIYMQ